MAARYVYMKLLTRNGESFQSASMIRVFAGKMRLFSQFRRYMCTAPEEVKLPRKQRIVNYFKQILDDYKSVAVEIGQDMKDRPIKSGIYISLLAGAVYLGKTNPSERDFKERLIENTGELLRLGDPIRNPTSDNHMQRLLKCYNTGQIRYLNFGLFSIMWEDNYSRGVDLYDAQCKSLKVGWFDLPERTLDVGVLGKWQWIEKAMTDYDINPDEWDENGNLKS